MKGKHLILAAACIVLLVLVGVFAQVPFGTSSIANWIGYAAPAAEAKRSDAAAKPVRANAQTFHNTLSSAQVTKHQDGDTVIIMRAEGDLPGVLTLKITRKGTQIVGGEFAFNVSYTQVTEIAHDEKPVKGAQHEHEDHSEILIQKGSLLGSLTGGEVILDDNGAVVGITSLNAALDRGSIEFENVSGGSVEGSSIQLSDLSAANGTLALTF